MRSDVQKIFLKTPKHKQVMMFSATLSDDIKTICKKFMNNVCSISSINSKKERIGRRNGKNI